ncbi:LuxR family transcriptional regulator [Arthrobacter sp. zg-Y1143]|uniref:helix-turn-helix transcriptional regulator n=1 Tax=Arthrobacter sp. zg-Y1143 TaxID=3049065 RepID=UPI0024C23E95|nr:LuxR family transcriptional regulator [Arthrobacter sp. zg-Y1143]MDK1328481.1 LuxR C-terminal-related transcriptional regulator [Arthrobacter sp. zg-Y1143]
MSVVISGADGTGKSTVMAHILGALGGEFSVLRLRGAAAWSGKPFGGLFWLLSELPPEALSNPVFVLQFVRGVLAEKAGGRRLVLAIENAEDLDVSTTAVLLQLCRAGYTLMLATVRDFSACPEEFVRWSADGSVHKEDLCPLPTAGTRTLLEDLSAGPVSSRLVAEVQQRTRGNPLLATLFFQEQVQAATVRRRRGTWVWTGAVSYAGALAERVETEIRGLSPAERYAVDVLAVSGGLPAPVILEVADPAAVERLEDMLLAAADSGPVRTLRLKDPLLAGAAAALVPHGRAKEIRSRVAAAEATCRIRGGPNAFPEEAAARNAVREAVELSRSGRWAEATEAARAGLDLLLEDSVRRRDLLSKLFCVFLRCGELRLAADVLARTEAGTEGVELPGGNDLCAGIVQVLGGRADKALDYLQRSLAQLEENRTQDIIPLASAAAAYACVLLDDAEAARAYLAASQPPAEQQAAGAREPDLRDTWQRDSAEGLAGALGRLCTVRGVPDGFFGPESVDTGSVEEGSVEEGSVEEGSVEEGSVQDGSGETVNTGSTAAAGQSALQLLVLAVSAFQGTAGAVEELRAAASACNGAAAAMYSDLAAGLADSDRLGVLRAARTAYSLGHYLLAHEAAGRAVRLARAHSDRTVLRTARRIENASFRMLLAANSVSDRLPELSDFERALAVGAAAGESSSDLAARLHLSPRTVDWHLGRIFSKLRVSGRAELRECLETERAEA